jgi:hypothetical protein
MGRVYETFGVAKEAVIVQDNTPARLADLKTDSHVTLRFDPEGKNVVRLSADGGTQQGRFASANPARNTVTVIAGKAGQRKTYHLVKESEVIAGGGKPGRVSDLKEGTMLQLTLSVEDPNTVIRIEPLPVERAKDP